MYYCVNNWKYIYLPFYSPNSWHDNSNTPIFQPKQWRFLVPFRRSRAPSEDFDAAVCVDHEMLTKQSREDGCSHWTRYFGSFRRPVESLGTITHVETAILIRIVMYCVCNETVDLQNLTVLFLLKLVQILLSVVWESIITYSIYNFANSFM